MEQQNLFPDLDDVTEEDVTVTMPKLRAGRDADTFSTSAAAADSVEDIKATQRRRVLNSIRVAGDAGRTDDELQELLQLDGSSERPRRWELWKQNQIDIRRDDQGKAIKRFTRTHRQAVVWIVKGAA